MSTAQAEKPEDAALALWRTRRAVHAAREVVLKRQLKTVAQERELGLEREAQALKAEIASRLTRVIIDAAFKGRRSLPEVPVAKLLGIPLLKLDVLTKGGVLPKPERSGRYTVDQLLVLLRDE